MDHAEAILTELRFAGAQAQRRTRWQARRSREPRPEGEDEPSALLRCGRRGRRGSRKTDEGTPIACGTIDTDNTNLRK